jgi:hypothetical protein
MERTQSVLLPWLGLHEPCFASSARCLARASALSVSGSWMYSGNLGGGGGGEGRGHD